MRIRGKKLRSKFTPGQTTLDRKKALRLRFRRQLRVQRRQVEELGAQAEQRLEDDFFMRLEKLGIVRRFVASWLLLVVLLIGVVVAQIRLLSGYYQVLAPAPGGTFTEGVLGTFTNANPIYATGLADTSVSELVFAGLLTYNHKNQLIGDLAESWKAEAEGTTYTLKLRPNLTWHDGRPVTAEDVVFTYQVIQNPDARSPFYNSWRGIEVVAKDPRTVVFTLPNPLASFPYSLTTGIVPKHILASVPMTNMRSISFNSTQPVGAGPFQWQAIELTGGTVETRQEKIALRAFDGYHGGRPELHGFVIRTFRDTGQLVKSFEAQEITAISGLTQVPDVLKEDSTVRVYNLPLTAAVMAFFRTQVGVLNSAKVRQALVAAADNRSILESLSYPTKPVRQPLLIGQPAHNKAYDQAAYNLELGSNLLKEEGWIPGTDGVRSKDGKLLTINLFYLDNPEYSSVATQLSKHWRAAGVDVKLTPHNEADFQGVLSSPDDYDYDALLYGISIGVDPDVYVYWHSSQINLESAVRLNFSAYKSSVADAALESGRTRLDPALRIVKYQPFLRSWRADAPALALYQPRFLYITRGPVHGLKETPINSDAGHLVNAHNWQIREEWVTPTE